jgi:hypothetical protein
VPNALRNPIGSVTVHRIGLFIPCYMDAFEPDVGVATLELLERLGCTVEYPFDQTCCGQPMVNTGCHKEAATTESLRMNWREDIFNAWYWGLRAAAPAPRYCCGGL